MSKVSTDYSLTLGDSRNGILKIPRLKMRQVDVTALRVHFLAYSVVVVRLASLFSLYKNMIHGNGRFYNAIETTRCGSSLSGVTQGVSGKNARSRQRPIHKAS